MDSRKKKLILFDYGGVVGKDHQDPAESKLMKFFGVERKAMQDLTTERSEHGTLYRENKITESQFWDKIRELTGVTDQSLSNSDLSLLQAQTYSLNLEFIEMLAPFRKECAIGIVTNTDRFRYEYLIDTVGILKYFDAVYPSFRFGSNKQKPEFWSLVQKDVVASYPNYEVMYVDDKIAHTISAGKVGWIGCHHTEINKTRAKLEEFIRTPCVSKTKERQK